MAGSPDFTKNSFVDRMMKLIPDHPLTQAQYMYYLSATVFFGILGYGLTSWYQFFTLDFALKNLFSAIFMTAVALMTTFGLKTARNAYLMQKAIWANHKPEEKKPAVTVESVESMLEGFSNAIGGKKANK